MSEKKILVIGLGNLVMSDDAVGPYAVRRAERALHNLSDIVDFKENYSGGIDMLYDMVGYDYVVLVDSVCTGEHEPGTCIEFKMSDFESLVQPRLTDSHGLNLPTVLSMGNTCGYKMPGEFLIIGVEAADTNTFSENLSGKVEAAMGEIVERICNAVSAWVNDNKVDILNRSGRSIIYG